MPAADRSTRRRRSGLIAALALVVALVTAACGEAAIPGGGKSDPEYGGDLTIGVEASWISLDPLRATTYVSYDVLQAVYEPLFDLNAAGDAVPNLALSYRASQDGLRYTVPLRPGVTFQDGTPFDAAAVVANFERMANPANGCSCLGELKILDGVRAVDPMTVEFTLKAPNAGFPVLVLASAPGLMASPKAFTEGDLAKHPVGTGPFVLADQVPNSSVRFTKWKGYRDPLRPYLDSVEFRVISDVDSRYSSLTSRAIDVADNISPTWIGDAKLNRALRIRPQGAAGSNFVMFQTGPGNPLSDPRARRAACMALDPALIDDALFGGVRPTGMQSPFPTGSTYDMGTVTGYASYDPKRAEELVKELGGLSFELQMSASPDNTRIAQALAAQWGVVGIRARIVTLDQPTLVDNAFEHRFDAMIYRWRGAMDPDGNVSRWFSGALATPGQKSSNFNLVSDPDLDRLMAEAKQPQERELRKSLYRRVSERLAQDMPYCYLWGADWNRITLANVYGIPDRPDNIITLTDAYVVA